MLFRTGKEVSDDHKILINILPFTFFTQYFILHPKKNFLGLFKFFNVLCNHFAQSSIASPTSILFKKSKSIFICDGKILQTFE